MTHSYAWHDSLIRLTWLIHTCDMTHKISYFNIISESQQSETFTRETWLHMWIMTHSSYQNYCDSLTLKELLSFWIPLTKWLVLWYHWRVVIHIKKRITPHVNEWFEKKRGMSRCMWMRHVTHFPRFYVWIFHFCFLEDTIQATSFDRGAMCLCDMTHPYVWHDSSICVTRPFICPMWTVDCIYVYMQHICMYIHTFKYVHVCIYIHIIHLQSTTSCSWPDVHELHDSSICVTWLIHMCDTTHPYVWQDSSICVTQLIHVCTIPQPYVQWGHSTCRKPSTSS